MRICWFVWLAGLWCVVGGVVWGAGGGRFVFEDLGQPLRPKRAAISVVTRDGQGGSMAWAVVESPSRTGLVGIDTRTGEHTWLDLARFGNGHIRATRAANGHLYIYAGNPGHFLKYDVNARRLTDLGVPARPASYVLGHAVGPDGKVYVGSYPRTHLVCLDPATDKVESLGTLATDPKERYIIGPAVSDAGVLYAPVGLHHAELWAYDTTTRQKRQILPEALRSATQCVRVWLGTDGRVYGRGGGKLFACKPDRIEVVHKVPPVRHDTSLRLVGDHVASAIEPSGELVMQHVKTGETRRVPTAFKGVAVRIYCVACEHKGKIYGGGFQPANVFAFDPATGRSADLGRHNGGTVQIYDILSHPKGLFLSSYVGAHQDFWNPDTGEHRHIACLVNEHKQERGVQLAVGPDKMIYVASYPAKGLLGGAITRINPADFTFKVWRNVVPSQSFASVVAVPRTGEMLLTSTVRGGTSAIATETEAWVVLWDVAKAAVAWKGRPIPGTKRYGKAVMGRNGILYVRAGMEYFAFDPVARRVVHRGRLPVKNVRPLGIADAPVGPKGLIYGLGGGAVFAIDPADHSVCIVARHPSIARAVGLLATKDGVLYYGSGSHLWRATPRGEP